MKTFFNWAILCMIYGFTMTAISCSDNDDNVPALSAPKGITYTNISSNSFTVTWTAVSDASTYTVKIKDEWGELTDKFQTVTEPYSYIHWIGTGKEILDSNKCYIQQQLFYFSF